MREWFPAFTQLFFGAKRRRFLPGVSVCAKRLVQAVFQIVAGCGFLGSIPCVPLRQIFVIGAIMAKSGSKVPQIAILLESSYGASRSRLRGIFQYARLYGPWELRMITGGPSDQHLPNLKRWKGCGVIARDPDQETIEAILKAKLPLILIDP